MLNPSDAWKGLDPWVKKGRRAAIAHEIGNINQGLHHIELVWNGDTPACEVEEYGFLIECNRIRIDSEDAAVDQFQDLLPLQAPLVNALQASLHHLQEF
jgi:hypothetical protein